jgi:hypothetical protein
LLSRRKLWGTTLGSCTVFRAMLVITDTSRYWNRQNLVSGLRGYDQSILH